MTELYQFLLSVFAVSYHPTSRLHYAFYFSAVVWQLIYWAIPFPTFFVPVKWLVIIGHNIIHFVVIW